MAKRSKESKRFRTAQRSKGRLRRASRSRYRSRVHRFRAAGTKRYFPGSEPPPSDQNSAKHQNTVPLYRATLDRSEVTFTHRSLSSPLKCTITLTWERVRVNDDDNQQSTNNKSDVLRQGFSLMPNPNPLDNTREVTVISPILLMSTVKPEGFRRTFSWEQGENFVECAVHNSLNEQQSHHAHSNADQNGSGYDSP